ncbi:hypothetical protein ACLOJK_005460 [Asimina triloba]
MVFVDFYHATFVMVDQKNKGNGLILLELVGTVEDGEARRLSGLESSQSGLVLNPLVNNVNVPLIQNIELQDHVLIMGTVQLSSNDQNGGSLICNLNLAGGGLREQFVELEKDGLSFARFCQMKR